MFLERMKMVLMNLQSEIFAVMAVPLIIGLFMLICLARIFSKAGKAGWKVLIPIYNTYVLYDIIYENGWKMFLIVVPILGQILGLILMFRLAKCFNKGFGFGLGLLLLPIIFLPILAFGKAEYYDTIHSFI